MDPNSQVSLPKSNIFAVLESTVPEEDLQVIEAECSACDPVEEAPPPIVNFPLVCLRKEKRRNKGVVDHLQRRGWVVLPN